MRESSDGAAIIGKITTEDENLSINESGFKKNVPINF